MKNDKTSGACREQEWDDKCIFFPVALQSLKDLGRLTCRRFLELFRHVVGLLGTSDQLVTRPLSTQDNTIQKDADKHPCLEGDSNPRSQQPTGQDPRLRPHGHCDLSKIIGPQLSPLTASRQQSMKRVPRRSSWWPGMLGTQMNAGDPCNFL
jgi:hypothetical protein